jgi:CRP/FNR family transcriptional regulator, cyclic AMP receptor protein
VSIEPLYDAVRSLDAPDAFKPRLSLEQWRVFGAYLARREVRAGETLLKEGEVDQTMYLLESGALQVFLSQPKPGQRLSVLRPGSVVGEAGLFSEQPRMANVEASVASVVWALNGQRYSEMALRSPAMTLEIVRAAAALMGVRMRANILLRHAIS